MRWLCALALAAVLGAPARALDFDIVIGDESGITHRIAEDLRPRLQRLFANAPGKRKTLYVAIGPLALRSASAHHDGVVLSLYTSSQVCHALLARGMGAIYAEPAPADQLRLVELLYRRPVRIATILSEDTAFLKDALPGVTLEDFDSGDDINRALNKIAQQQVLLAVPDRAVYNTENIRNILLSTYRHNQGVIGFSADMVKAGALASTYSSVEDINAQAVDIVRDWLESDEMPAPQFPRYFRTIVNDGVARSLGVAVDDTARHFARRP
ncbi:MAG: hypothetical protein V4463_14120 [Pseudomonadota bacterium]